MIAQDTNSNLISGSLLKGKKGLVMGVANNRSIAYGMSLACFHQGASLAFSYQGEALKKRVEPIAQSMNSDYIFECDVANEQSMDRMFEHLEKTWGGIDFIIHSIAFSDKNELQGRCLDTSIDNFQNTMRISCYSLIAIAKRAERLMHNGGSIVTLTYYGAEKVIPNYNVMGIAKAALESTVRYLSVDLGPKNIRMNAISAGPIKTLAASAIGDFITFLRLSAENSPLKRDTTIADIGNTGVYLLSDLSSGVTGEVLHVDCGYHIVGAPLRPSS